MDTTLYITDPHEPFSHPRFFEFACDLAKKYRPKNVVLGGDMADLHALSFHEHDPDGLSPGNEIKQAKEAIQKWYKKFPKARVCIGNHDARTIRLARKAGLPCEILKDFSEIWATPKWEWDWEFEIDGVIYTHGTGCSGKNGALNMAMARRQSVVIGHIHAWAGVQFHANKTDRIFGMNAGCGIDCGRYAFTYAKDFVNRPILGCGLVTDEGPRFIPMQIGPGERYERDRDS